MKRFVLLACVGLSACGGGGGGNTSTIPVAPQPGSSATPTATPTPTAAPTSQPQAGWRLTTYYTPVQSFYSGAPQTTSVGTYPSDFLTAVQTEGSGKLSPDHYINYSNGSYALDTLPRDAQGNALIPFRSAAADTSIPFGTTLKVLGCGADTNSGTPTSTAVCSAFQWQSAWVVTDRFAAGTVGQHIDLYIGEQTSAVFTNNANYIDTSGANVALGAVIAPPPWKPNTSDTFQIIFTGALDTTSPASVYELDSDGSSPSDPATLHALNRHAVCYIDGGSWESYRSDASSFPSSVLGSSYPGFPNERWLDIRQISVLGPIMQKRLDACAAKGFDAVHPDNMNGYEASSGFPLSAADQIAYDSWFASLAHERHLAIALDDPDQIQQLEPIYDYALQESCSAQGCGFLSPFNADGKAVLVIEYDNVTSSATFTGTYCPQAKALGFDVILKHPSMDAWIQTCP